jgi:hypothetical protein
MAALLLLVRTYRVLVAAAVMPMFLAQKRLEAKAAVFYPLALHLHQAVIQQLVMEVLVSLEAQASQSVRKPLLGAVLEVRQLQTIHYLTKVVARIKVALVVAKVQVFQTQMLLLAAMLEDLLLE